MPGRRCTFAHKGCSSYGWDLRRRTVVLPKGKHVHIYYFIFFIYIYNFLFVYSTCFLMCIGFYIFAIAIGMYIYIWINCLHVNAKCVYTCNICIYTHSMCSCMQYVYENIYIYVYLCCIRHFSCSLFWFPANMTCALLETFMADSAQSSLSALRSLLLRKTILTEGCTLNIISWSTLAEMGEFWKSFTSGSTIFPPATFTCRM